MAPDNAIPFGCFFGMLALYDFFTLLALERSGSVKTIKISDHTNILDDCRLLLPLEFKGFL
jgi:hypothetical protein